MAQRDYIEPGRTGGRRRKSSKRSRTATGSKIMLLLAIAVLIAFLAVLYFISREEPGQLQHTLYPPTVGHGLPPKPEERWSYIKELENRQVSTARPVSPPANEGVNSTTPLTKEQRELLEQIQADMRQQPTELAAVSANGRPEVPRSMVIDTTPPPSSAVKASTTLPASEQSKTSSGLVQQPGKPAPTKKTEQKTKARWLLQCGSFRNVEQAESIRAQLAFSGIESRIATEGGWKRVVLGPYSDRESAASMLNRLRNNSTSGCVMLGIEG